MVPNWSTEWGDWRKLVGAGGGGFLMFYAKDKQKLIHAMEVQGLHQVRFRFDFEGTKL